MCMANILGSISGVLNAANVKTDQIATIGKGILCLPTILSNFFDNGKGAIGGIKAGITAALQTAGAAFSTLISNAVQNKINVITGVGESTVNTVQSIIGTLGATKGLADSFITKLRNKSTDIMTFIDDKENCNFAAATLSRCIVNEALTSVTPRIAVDVSKGLYNADSAVSNIINTLEIPSKAVNSHIDKTAGQIERANKLISISF